MLKSFGSIFLSFGAVLLGAMVSEPASIAAAVPVRTHSMVESARAGELTTSNPAATSEVTHYSMHWVVNSKRLHALEGAGLVKPNDIVYGDCGSSYMSIGNLGDGKAQISFGFHVDFDAWSYTWSTGLASTNGYSSGRSGGGTLFAEQNWDGGYQVTSGYGELYGAAYMTATDFDGSETCVSNGPTASAFIS